MLLDGILVLDLTCNDSWAGFEHFRSVSISKVSKGPPVGCLKHFCVAGCLERVFSPIPEQLRKQLFFVFVLPSVYRSWCCSHWVDTLLRNANHIFNTSSNRWSRKTNRGQINTLLRGYSNWVSWWVAKKIIVSFKRGITGPGGHLNKRNQLLLPTLALGLVKARINLGNLHE